MRVAYQHVNPYEGRESTLVRLHDERYEQTACVLVDAGEGVTLLCLTDDSLATALSHGQSVRLTVHDVGDAAPPETPSSETDAQPQSNSRE